MNRYVIISTELDRSDHVECYTDDLEEAKNQIRNRAEDTQAEYFIFVKTASFKCQWTE